MLTPDQLLYLKTTPATPNRLRTAMQLCGMTQVQVAAAVGVKQPYISQLVNGDHPAIPYETVRKFAELFGCDMVDLFPSKAA